MGKISKQTIEKSQKSMKDIVEKMRQIATAAHKGQKRKFSDEPYEVHPFRVGDSFEDPLRRVLGYGHDTIEDTRGTDREVTPETLSEAGIPEAVIIRLIALTRSEHETYFDYITRLVDFDLVVIDVKLADLEDNMSDLHEGSLKDKYRLAAYILEQSRERLLAAEKKHRINKEEKP
jgi:(p)ppGpp synthase/HD superfamily hydrolase